MWQQVTLAEMDVRSVSRRAWLRRSAAPITIAAATQLLSACAYVRIPGYQFSPALFEIKHHLAKTESYLFGSMHAGLDRFYPLPKTVNECIARCSSLAVELDTKKRYSEATDLFRPHVRLPSGTSLSSVIGQNNFNAMARYFNWFAEDIKAKDQFAPWYITLFLSSADDERTPVEERVGVETILMANAREKNKPIIELETVQDQVNAFVQGSLDEQTEHLLMRFEQIQKWDNTANDLIEAWRLGDLNLMESVKSRNFGSATKLASLRKRMFERRDEKMAERLISHMAESPGPCFAIVGALHLAGTDSMQSVLERAGASVTRVVY
jgi:uncharacterized protein